MNEEKDDDNEEERENSELRRRVDRILNYLRLIS